MKIAYKDINTGKWINITKVKTLSVCEEIIILKMIDGSIRTLNRNDVQYMRETKLYEGMSISGNKISNNE